METQIQQIELEIESHVEATFSQVKESKKDSPISKCVSKRLSALAFISAKNKKFPVEVKNSPKHGRGVFATSAIKKGSLLTLFPGDIVTYILNGNIEEEHQIFCGRSHRMAKEIKGKEVGIYTQYLSEYCLIVDEHYSIIGYPPFEDDSAYLGHLINDAVFGNFRDLSPETYLELSNQSCNCDFEAICNGKIIAVIASQDIEAGVELLTTYGIPFWTKYCKKKGIRWYLINISKDIGEKALDSPLVTNSKDVVTEEKKALDSPLVTNSKDIVTKGKKTLDKAKKALDSTLTTNSKDVVTKGKKASNKGTKPLNKEEKTLDINPEDMVTLYEGDLFKVGLYKDKFILDIKAKDLIPLKQRTATEKLEIFIRNLTQLQQVFIKRIKNTQFKGPDDKMIEINEAKTSLMTFIMPPILDINVELRPSCRHGRGVFATKDLEKDTILTLHPCDILSWIVKGNRCEENHVILPSLSHRMSRVINVGEAGDYCKKLWDYSVDIDNDYAVVGNPNFDDNPQYLGHFINDGFMGDFSVLTPSLYSELSGKKSNCHYEIIVDRCIVVVLADRHIKKGEELLACYGINFWKLYNRKHNILTKY
jgi:hypothetical protein